MHKDAWMSSGCACHSQHLASRCLSYMTYPHTGTFPADMPWSHPLLFWWWPCLWLQLFGVENLPNNAHTFIFFNRPSSSSFDGTTHHPQHKAMYVNNQMAQAALYKQPFISFIMSLAWLLDAVCFIISSQSFFLFIIIFLNWVWGTVYLSSKFIVHRSLPTISYGSPAGVTVLIESMRAYRKREISAFLFTFFHWCSLAWIGEEEEWIQEQNRSLFHYCA